MIFFKMEGAGNDYVYLDLRESNLDPSGLDASILPALCDRRYGIGADGIVLIAPSSRGAAARMWMWNADGSSSDMCGNALRCVALYVSRDHQLDTSFLIESGAGLHAVQILAGSNSRSGRVRIDMGAPVFEAERIPYRGESREVPVRFRAEAVDLDLREMGAQSDAWVLSMGNPHCVLFVKNPDSVDVQRFGRILEHHASFPERTNVEFVSVREDGTLYQRTWERGSGETLACGSGACAVLVASVLSERGPRRNTVHLRGGDLEVEWTDSSVWMEGPARFVFNGEIDPEIFNLFPLSR